MTGGRSSRHCGRVGNVTVRGRVRARLGSGKLVKEAALGIVGEALRGLAGDDSSWLQSNLLTLEVALKRIEKESVMRNREPDIA